MAFELSTLPTHYCAVGVSTGVIPAKFACQRHQGKADCTAYALSFCGNAEGAMTVRMVNFENVVARLDAR